ncbi:hypothetical protein [Celerinatantimonas sp. MCCC 1A17872]|uniref:hypothetical protein n=1 Tax=Celerinatantimonas sp. MCCC 1A17872 TaxID=3177514 RepID=UPI0038C38EBE
MKVQAKQGQLVTDLLYQNLGDDNDQLEAAFYELNSQIRVAIFPEAMTVTLPDVASVQKQTTVIRSWD